MMRTDFQILNQRLCFKNVLKYLSAFHEFESSYEEYPDIQLNCEAEHLLSTELCKENLPSLYGISYLSAGEKTLVFFPQNDTKHFLRVNREDYSNWQLTMQEDCSDVCFMELLMAGFYSYISLKDALLMHASAVSYQDQAIVFTAASGTGKTTQAELWQKYREAVILNGDKVFLKQETDGIHAWGSPWKGSSPYSENKSAVLNAIIVLEQAEENAIRKLSGLETLEKVIPHIFLPQWDRKCENAVLNFLDQVLRTTDIYFLQCRPDEEAVALVERTLFNPS